MGNQGSLLAHTLLKGSNNEVTILARGERKDTLEECGIVIRHYLKNRLE